MKRTRISRKRQTNAILSLSNFISLLLISIPHENLLASASQAAGTETLIGIVGQDYILLGADSTTSSSIAVLGRKLDKIPILIDPFPHHGDNVLLDHYHHQHQQQQQQQQVVACAHAGEAADGDVLLNALQAHVEEKEWEGGLGCDVEYLYRGEDAMTQSGNMETSMALPSRAGLDAGEVACLARHYISSSLRTAGRLSTCLLIAGMVRTCETSSRVSQMQTVGTSSVEPEVKDDAEHGNEGLSSFSQRIQRQVQAATQLIESQNDNEKVFTPIDSVAAAHITQAASSRTKTSLQPRLFWLDEYGSLQSIQFGAHGHGSNFILSILDQKYRPNLTREEAAQLMRNCFEQLRTRYVINCPEPPCIKCIDAQGWRHV